MADYEGLISQILDGYKSNYDVERFEDRSEGLIATAHMHVTECQCVIFEEFKMWTADADEYVYIFKVPKLTDELCERFINEAYEDGMPKINLDHVSIKNQHMCTHLVALFICDEADEEAVKRIKKCKIYKNFMFSLKGWMEMHTVLLNLSDESVVSNRYGTETAKFLKMHIDHYRSKCK